MQKLFNMKYTFYIIVFNLIVGIFLAAFPDILDFIIFDSLSMLFVLLVGVPYLSGALSILLQDKKRSYDYLPTMLITAVLNSLIFTIILSGDDLIFTFLALVGIFLFGALIGLVIRGFSAVIIGWRQKNQS